MLFWGTYGRLAYSFMNFPCLLSHTHRGPVEVRKMLSPLQWGVNVVCLISSHAIAFPLLMKTAESGILSTPIVLILQDSLRFERITRAGKILC